MFAMITKATLPHLEPTCTLLSCGIYNEYGWDQTGFHGAFVRFPKPGSCGQKFKQTTALLRGSWNALVLAACVVPRLPSDLSMARSLHSEELGRPFRMCFVLFFLPKRTVGVGRGRRQRDKKEVGAQGWGRGSWENALLPGEEGRRLVRVWVISHPPAPAC